MPQTSSFHWIWVATQCCHRCHQISLQPRYISGSAALGRHGFRKEKTELEVTPSHKGPSRLMKLCVWATSLGLSDLGSRLLTAWPIPLFVWYWAPNCAAWTWHFRDLPWSLTGFFYGSPCKVFNVGEYLLRHFAGPEETTRRSGVHT